MLTFMEVHSSLIDHIWDWQFEDEKLCLIQDKVSKMRLRKLCLILMF